MSATLSLLRVIGYTTSIVLHWGNIFYLSRTDFNSYENKDIRTFGALQYRYLTCWTFFLQSVHALLGLICEYLLFKNGKRKDYKLPKYLRGARDTLFSAIVFPSTFLVATVFWSLYHYDKTVILPSYVFEFLTPTSNHIMHTWIVPLSLWEVFCQPRYIPRSHVRNISHLAFHMVLYLSVPAIKRGAFAEGDISKVLVKSLAEAHANTNPKLEFIHEMFRKPPDVSKLLFYRSMSYEEMWLDCADKLTGMIQNIIEFAKLIPGFMKLGQDDQIMLLKTGSFELAIVRMSRLIDIQRDQVLYGDVVLPIREAIHARDPRDVALVAAIFEAAKSIARLKLTETELALYQSLVLLWPERHGVRGNSEILCLFNMSMSAMRNEVEVNHAPLKGDVTVLDTVLAKIPAFRDLAVMHLEALSRFKAAHPHHVFPALYKELFSLDNVMDYNHP